MIKRIYFLTWIFLLFTVPSFSEKSLEEQFKSFGFLEICDHHHGTATYNSLYTAFDEFIDHLQKNPSSAIKLTIAKERFIRSKDREYYSTDFFGFYDESKKQKRNQISFYYSVHFHEFIKTHYKELNDILEISSFFDACLKVQDPYVNLFTEVANTLNLDTIFSSKYGKPPILLKVIKYFPSYTSIRPHYDGSVFSLLLDSTDNQSLLLSPYQSSYLADDFVQALRQYERNDHQNSILLIPGVLLAEFSIYPTPHIVIHSGKIRYATVAFAMRPHNPPQKNDFSPLPLINH